MSQAAPAPSLPKTPITRRLPVWVGPLFALVLLIAVTIVIEWINKGRSDFIKPENLFNILRNWSFVGIIAIGMTFVILLGGIDLSVGSLVAFCGGLAILLFNALLAITMPALVAIPITFLAILFIGMAAGAVNGLLVTFGRIAPFIATLGGLVAYRSLALTMANGGTFQSQAPSAFGLIGQGGIPIPGTNIAPRAATAMPLLIPWPVVIFFAVAIVAAIVLRYTRYGRHVMAIGSNEATARLCGVAVRRVKIYTYALLGCTTALAAVLLASYMNAIPSTNAGSLYELDVIAAVVIGGTAMRGGRGTIFGTVLGVLILCVVSNMLIMLHVSTYLQGLVKGIIIITAVLIQRADRRDA